MAEVASASPPLPPAGTRTAAGALNVTAWLAVLGWLELILVRLGARLFLPNGGLSSGANRGLQVAAAALTHFTGALGLLLFASAFVVLLRRRELLPWRMVVTLGFIACVLVASVAAGLFSPARGEAALLYARICEAFLGVLLWVAVLRTETAGRAKAALGALVAAIGLSTLAVFAPGAGWNGSSALARAAELIGLGTALASPLTLAHAPARARTRLVCAGVALAASTVVCGLLIARFDWAQAFTIYGLRLELPPPVGAAAVAYLAAVVLAAGTLALTIGWSLVRPGPSTLLGWSLLLVLAGGWQPASATQVPLSMVGVLGLCVALGRGAVH